MTDADWKIEYYYGKHKNDDLTKAYLSEEETSKAFDKYVALIKNMEADCEEHNSFFPIKLRMCRYDFKKNRYVKVKEYQTKDWKLA